MHRSTRHTPDEVAQAVEAVSQMFAQVKAEPTPAEAMLWADEIERIGPRAVMQFAQFWMSGGGQGGFLRAPRIADLRRFCDPTWSDEASALARLQTLVSHVGPYRAPLEADGMDARLAEAVRAMGGWARVCELMPDASDDYAFRTFEKRFSVAWQQAEARSVRGEVQNTPLLPIRSQPAIAAPQQNARTQARLDAGQPPCANDDGEHHYPPSQRG